MREAAPLHRWPECARYVPPPYLISCLTIAKDGNDKSDSSDLGALQEEEQDHNADSDASIDRGVEESAWTRACFDEDSTNAADLERDEAQGKVGPARTVRADGQAVHWEPEEAEVEALPDNYCQGYGTPSAGAMEDDDAEEEEVRALSVHSEEADLGLDDATTSIAGLRALAEEDENNDANAEL
ncbi:hypothetical protein B0H10DRAFT_2203634 [Mycena sp. CBHHK59/15]|nr:hypothetical protein B0H10DRAFT_2203634 [Mycena sp. CBHHK59/15]